MTFTHLDAERRPTMVDVGDKTPTKRTATAEARVRFPPAVAAALRDSGLRSPKGPVFDTAIVAGVMGAKRTHELIPFCHPLGLENCRIAIDLDGDAAVIRCTVSVHHKTGVEMEALTGASIAALTVYDMCKALSHDIVIGDLRLIAKDGGKSGYVQRGGAVSSRARVRLDSRRRLEFAHAARQGCAAVPRQEPAGSGLRAGGPACRQVFVSVRANQTADPARAQRPMIVDSVAGEGPIVGIRSALAAHPHVAWLVLACDLPFLSDAALVAARCANATRAGLATAYRSAHDGLPEPLCAIWEPAAAAALAAYPGRRRPLPAKISHASRRRSCSSPRTDGRSTTSIRPRNTRRLWRPSTPPLRPCHAIENPVLRLDARAGRPLRGNRRDRGGHAGGSVRRIDRALRLHAVARTAESRGQQRVQRLVAPARAGDAVVFIPPVAGG